MIKDNDLYAKAWEARELAHAWKSKTKVGCAIETDRGNVVVGYNIEGLWMTSIHAEVCAVAKLVGLNEKGIKVVVVADADLFTPCGACLDWLNQFCIQDALVIARNMEGETFQFKLGDLCPHYPRQ